MGTGTRVRLRKVLGRGLRKVIVFRGWPEAGDRLRVGDRVEGLPEGGARGSSLHRVLIAGLA